LSSYKGNSSKGTRFFFTCDTAGKITARFVSFYKVKWIEFSNRSITSSRHRHVIDGAFRWNVGHSWKGRDDRTPWKVHPDKRSEIRDQMCQMFHASLTIFDGIEKVSNVFVSESLLTYMSNLWVKGLIGLLESMLHRICSATKH
jgi:hypothetical protein